MLFLRVLKMPFNDERGILLLNLFTVTAFESIVLLLHRVIVGNTKAYSQNVL